MNTVGAAALVVLAVVSLLWTALLIPALLELRRATWRLQEFIRTLELELRPTLQEAREGIRTVRQASQAVAEGAAHLRGAMAAMEEAGGNIRATTGVLRAVFGSRSLSRRAGESTSIRTSSSDEPSMTSGSRCAARASMQRAAPITALPLRSGTEAWPASPFTMRRNCAVPRII